MTLDLYERNALFCALLITQNENEFAYIYYLLTSRRKATEKVKNKKIPQHIQRIFKDVNSEYYNNYQRNYKKKRRKNKNI